MTANQSIALMRYNARRCAQSRQRVCRCRCGGQYHGKEHPGTWMDTQAQLIREHALAVALIESEQQERLPGMEP